MTTTLPLLETTTDPIDRNGSTQSFSQKPSAGKDLEPIFYPRSVAVVGATDVEGSVPFDIFYNILKDRFRGPVYPVSPGLRSIASVRTYKYIVNIDEPVDLAVLVFPSSVCHMALEQCGKKGVKGAIIISAGFREAGPAGIEREAKLKEIAARYGISFVGPNCLGVINTDPLSHLNASFSRDMPAEGSIAFLSQSGALCTAVLDYAQDKQIGFSKFVSFGNKADVSEIDLLYYLKDDPKTKIILLYLEEVSNGRALMEAARTVIRETGKPILAIKSGRTSAGAAAAASHTGSLAGSDDICDAAFRQAGIIRCASLEEMFNRALALNQQPLPHGPRIAIVTNAGGPGVLAADEAIRQDLVLAQFSPETTAVLKKHLPPSANIKNPVDVIGDARADRYNSAVAATLADAGVDGVGVILTPQSMTQIEEIAADLVRVADGSSKPVYASFMGGKDVAAGIRILREAGVPHYTQPEAMVQAFESALNFRKVKNQPPSSTIELDAMRPDVARDLLAAAADAGRKHLPGPDALAILSAYGLPVLPSALATSEDEAASAAECDCPLALKIVSDDVVHKVDAGGVLLDVRGKEAARRAYRTIIENVKRVKPGAVIKGVLVERMAPAGQEVILGLKHDPSFGPVVMFGMGGTFVEVFRDVAFRVAPVTPDEAAAMIRETKAYKLLAGTRGRPASDLAAIEECILRLSQLAVDFPQIQELDINPLIVGTQGSGCHVADARILL